MGEHPVTGSAMTALPDTPDSGKAWPKVAAIDRYSETVDSKVRSVTKTSPLTSVVDKAARQAKQVLVGHIFSNLEVMTFLRLSVCGISGGLHYFDLIEKTIFASLALMLLLMILLQVFSIDPL